MKQVKIGVLTYTYNEDGTITRTVDEVAKAAIIEQKLKEE